MRVEASAGEGRDVVRSIVEEVHVGRIECDLGVACVPVHDGLGRILLLTVALPGDKWRRHFATLRAVIVPPTRRPHARNHRARCSGCSRAPSTPDRSRRLQSTVQASKSHKCTR